MTTLINKDYQIIQEVNGDIYRDELNEKIERLFRLKKQNQISENLLRLLVKYYLSKYISDDFRNNILDNSSSPNKFLYFRYTNKFA